MSSFENEFLLLSGWMIIHPERIPKIAGFHLRKQQKIEYLFSQFATSKIPITTWFWGFVVLKYVLSYRWVLEMDYYISVLRVCA